MQQLGLGMQKQTQCRNQNLSIYEDDQTITAEAALPGLSENEIEVIFENGTLSIQGTKQESAEDQKKKYLRKMTSSFSYQLTIPGDIDETIKPSAECKDGIARVTFQKQKRIEPMRIQVHRGK
jgi:HSP20 family molecular chaperone IbpA